MTNGNHANGNGAAKAALSNLIVWIFRIVTPPIMFWIATIAWDMNKSLNQLENEMRYQSLRMHNIEAKAEIKPPPPWFERGPGYQ